jgi:hypothetical protein
MRCKDLLKFIVQRTLSGQHDCLKERMIGIEVFRRANDYNTNQDATVRVAVTEVRKRLARYYEEPGRQNELHIDLPAGSYVAEFRQPHIPVEAKEAILPGRPPRSLYIAMPIMAVVLLVVIWGAIRLTGASPIDRFWKPVLDSPEPILISLAVPGNQQTPSAYVNNMGKYLAQQANFPVPDLTAANSINSFLASRRKRSVISLAPSITLSDLHRAAAIVLGSDQMNQWASHLGANLRFRFQDEAGGSVHMIKDAHDPGNKSWAVDLNQPYKQISSEFVLITRTFDPTTGQWWIGIGGTTSIGTIGGQQILVESSAMKALIAQLPVGWERKNLQVVVAFNMVDGSIGGSKVVGAYTW